MSIKKKTNLDDDNWWKAHPGVQSSQTDSESEQRNVRQTNRPCSNKVLNLQMYPDLFELININNLKNFESLNDEFVLIEKISDVHI